MEQKRLGVIGDWLSGSTGFGTVLRGILTPLKDKYQISQFAINYDGSWHPDQQHYRFYTAADMSRQDPYGIQKVKIFVEATQPDCVFVLQDPWIADKYAIKIREIRPDIPLVLYTPVDSNGLDRSYVNILNMYDRVVTYTEYARGELQKAGLVKPCDVIPHGVDTENIYPVDRYEARRILGLPQEAEYIVLYVAQNQPRKRVDLFIWLMSEWLKRYPHDDVYYYYHGPINRPGGVNVPMLVERFAKQHTDIDFADRFLTTTDKPNVSIKRESMRYIYSSADVFLQCAAAEGWGMGLHEAMASKLATITPDYSALSEWPQGGTFYVPVDDKPNFYTSGVNTEHRDINVHWAIEALETIYQDEQLRADLGKRGYEVATQEKYSWPRISQQFDTIFESVIQDKEITTP